MRLKADLSLLLIAVIWGSAFVAQCIAGQLGSVYLFSGGRYILAGLVVLPFAWRVRQPTSLPYEMPREQYKWMFIAGLLLFVAAAL
jgi:drug/metabolite transporter (DMT)-like permease